MDSEEADKRVEWDNPAIDDRIAKKKISVMASRRLLQMANYSSRSPDSEPPPSSELPPSDELSPSGEPPPIKRPRTDTTCSSGSSSGTSVEYGRKA